MRAIRAPSREFSKSSVNLVNSIWSESRKTVAPLSLLTLSCSQTRTTTATRRCAQLDTLATGSRSESPTHPAILPRTSRDEKSLDQ
jgi:hypothetical protein